MKDTDLCTACGKEIKENNRKERIQYIHRRGNEGFNLCDECGKEIEGFICKMIERRKR